jgi:multidrug efflux pump subunit AcrA (membrane-fusion protein)
MGDETPTQMLSPGEGEPEPPESEAWSRRSQIAFVGVAMPILVFLLVGAPYLLSHYFVNIHYRFNYIPSPLGGERALEGHWTDAPLAPVRRVKFGAQRNLFGWIAPDDDLTKSVFATTPGTVAQVYVSVGQAIAKDAPLFSIRPHVAGAGGDAQPAPQEIVVAAPIAGLVTQLGVAAGQIIKNAKAETAAPAVAIADPSSLWLLAEIEEGDARALRPDEPIEVRPTALPGRVFAGRLLSVSALDPQTMRASARILIDNADGGLKLNMLAAFSSPNLDEAETPGVPEGAVLFENGSTRVFVVGT